MSMTSVSPDQSRSTPTSQGKAAQSIVSAVIIYVQVFMSQASVSGSLRSRLALSPIYPWLVFSTVCTGTFMANLDGSILNIALPVLQREFGIELARLQWVVSIYLLVVTAILPAMGALADRFGRRNFYICGLLLFTVGSICCALSGNLNNLLFARFLQAFGGSMIMGNGMSIIVSVFPTGKRGQALGIISSVVAIGTLTGPALGGLLIERSGWPMIFWINVPIGVLGIAMGWLLLPKGKGQVDGSSFDMRGSFYFIVAMSGLVLFLSNGHLWGWLGAYSLTSLAFAAVGGVAFVREELRAQSPLIDMSLFRRAGFSFGLCASYLSYVVMGFPALLLPLFLTTVLHLPLSETGWIMSAQPIAMMLTAPVGGWMADRYGYAGPAAFGMGLTFIALVWMANFGVDTGHFQLLFAMVFFGSGLGLFMSPNNTSVIESGPPEKTGFTASLLATVRNFGRVGGVTFAVLLFGDAATTKLTPESLAHHTSITMLVGAVLSLVALALSFGRLYGVGRKKLMPE
jgi:EmrB/QacA subfamily drug resistance transporter